MWGLDLLAKKSTFIWSRKKFAETNPAIGREDNLGRRKHDRDDDEIKGVESSTIVYSANTPASFSADDPGWHPPDHLENAGKKHENSRTSREKDRVPDGLSEKADKTSKKTEPENERKQDKRYRTHLKDLPYHPNPMSRINLFNYSIVQ